MKKKINWTAILSIIVAGIVLLILGSILIPGFKAVVFQVGGVIGQLILSLVQALLRVWKSAKSTWKNSGWISLLVLVGGTISIVQGARKSISIPFWVGVIVFAMAGILLIVENIATF